MLRVTAFASRLLPLLVLTALVTAAWVPVASAAAPSSGITLGLASDGTIAAGFGLVVGNGSALRYAMDGNFSPLVNSLPVSNTTKATILTDIGAIENNPITAGLFGSRTGHVDSTDVSKFETLVLSYAKYIPVSSFTGVLNVTMDGKVPATNQLQTISFSNATGPDNSSGPMGVVATLDVTFSWSGVGSSHVFEVAWNLPSDLGNLSLPVQPVNFSFSTPVATTITSVAGLTATQVSNDPYGWGSASTSGLYTPLPGHTIVIRFGPSFPTGDVLIGGLLAVAAVVSLAALLLRRRRRRRAAATPTTPRPEGVGPSSGSG